MRRKIIMLTGIVAIGIAVYVFTTNYDSKVSVENDIQDVKQLVNEYSVGSIKAKSASITSRQLIVTESDNSQVQYNLPEDEFFLSIAPYLKVTHPCATHSLTGCLGEMTDEEFSVYIEDMDGK